jgi:enoyl-CoA hydratase
VIDHAFGADSVPEIITRLERDGGAFARETVKTLRTMSPSSLVWSLRLLRQGAQRTLPACLDAELRATRTVTAGHEFIEGVRAMVVDKDRAPKWQPARIEDVDRGAAEAMVG